VLIKLYFSFQIAIFKYNSSRRNCQVDQVLFDTCLTSGRDTYMLTATGSCTWHSAWLWGMHTKYFLNEYVNANEWMKTTQAWEKQARDWGWECGIQELARRYHGFRSQSLGRWSRKKDGGTNPWVSMGQKKRVS
jgi:hypothetical protein